MPMNEEAEMQSLLERLSPPIGELLVRMMAAGDLAWPDVRAFRDEFVTLNPSARTDEEQIALLFAFDSLMNRVEADELIEPESFAEFRNIRKADYLMLLNVQAMTDDLIVPARLDKITEREVRAGRLAPDDEFRKFAQVGGRVLGVNPAAQPKRDFFARLVGRR